MAKYLCPNGCPCATFRKIEMEVVRHTHVLNENGVDVEPVQTETDERTGNFCSEITCNVCGAAVEDV